MLEAYTAPGEFDSHGQRVVEGQRLMQAYGDVLLGWRQPAERAAPHHCVRRISVTRGI